MAFEPFLRWAGGKTWLVPYLPMIIGDTSFRHYHEPFLGGGAVFFNTNHQLRSYLSDSNKDLINAYLCVRDIPEEVIKVLQTFENTEERYYHVRDTMVEEASYNAAKFIFLNHTSYNGLYRVNKQGLYNVPFGHRKWICDPNKILSASDRLKNTNIRTCDFEGNKYLIQRNDLVFLDPPYTVSHNHNGFIKYNQNLFSIDDQRRLSRLIDYIKRKDAYYILTNAAHESIELIFEKGDRRYELKRPSLIGGKNAKREHIAEYVFTNLPEA